MARPFVHEVDLGVPDPRPVMRDTIQFTLRRPPVEPIGPVSKQPFQPIPVSALRPGAAGGRPGQAGIPDPRPQIIDHRRINPDRERLNPEQ
jgi:hypothetical protein